MNKIILNLNIYLTYVSNTVHYLQNIIDTRPPKEPIFVQNKKSVLFEFLILIK